MKKIKKKRLQTTRCIVVPIEVYDRMQNFVTACSKLGLDTSISRESQKALTFWMNELEKDIFLKL